MTNGVAALMKLAKRHDHLPSHVTPGADDPELWQAFLTLRDLTPPEPPQEALQAASSYQPPLLHLDHGRMEHRQKDATAMIPMPIIPERFDSPEAFLRFNRELEDAMEARVAQEGCTALTPEEEARWEEAFSVEPTSK